MKHRPSAQISPMAASRVASRAWVWMHACAAMSVATTPLLAPVAAWSAPNNGNTATAAGIYSCVDSSGKRLTSDRPIPECLDREQRVLNKDGSQKQTLPPRMNAEERALEEERQHQKARAEAAAKDAIRRDRNLMLRYPDEATHHKAREAVLDDLRKGIKASERHFKELQDERKPLIAETDFYRGRRMPGKLKGKLEANEAQQQAQQDIIQNQRIEIDRVNALYDAELARLKRLWAGAMPGSMPMAASSGVAR